MKATSWSYDDRLIHIDINQCKKSWAPILLKNNINNEYVITYLSNFLESYNKFYNHMTLPKSATYVGFDPDIIDIATVIELIIKDLNEYVNSVANTKVEIKHEYYNVLNGKKGLLLDNGLRVEDDKIIDYGNTINKKLKHIMDNRIKYVLDPSYRNVFLREEKLKRILDDSDLK